MAFGFSRPAATSCATCRTRRRVSSAICGASATGRANFGFTSKYLPGAQRPSGNTEFQFQTGNLAFLAAFAAAVTWRTGPTDGPLLQLGLFVFALVALTRASVDLLKAR